MWGSLRVKPQHGGGGGKCQQALEGLKFKRQYPIGPYVADFVCLSQKLVVELDGSHHLDQVEYDKERTNYMTHFGFRVIRFWNHDVINRLPLVLEKILQEVKIFE